MSIQGGEPSDLNSHFEKDLTDDDKIIQMKEIIIKQIDRLRQEKE